MTENYRIGVLGAGSWGTTLAILLCENEHRVTMWEFDEKQAQVLKETRANEVFLPGARLPDELGVTSVIEEAVADKDIVLFVVPSHVVRATAGRIASAGLLPNDALVVNAAKGIEEETLQRMSQVLTHELDVPERCVLSLMGPSHAEEVSRQIPTSVVIAGIDQGNCSVVQSVFMRPYFRVYTNDDLIGVEIAVALKNSIAIAAGIIDGLEYGDNTKAALITRGLSEITRLGIEMGASAETFSGLAGVGDLVVTCLSRHSRNRHVGESIGRGRPLEEVLGGMVMVAEGVRTTRAAVRLAKQYKVELPIIEMVYKILFEGHDAREAIDTLMARPARAEAHQSFDRTGGNR